MSGCPGFFHGVIVVEHPEHLIPVPQLLGHDAQHGHLHLIGGRFFERQAMLLDGAELGGGLGADDVARRIEHVADHLAGVLEARLAGHAAEGIASLLSFPILAVSANGVWL